MPAKRNTGFVPAIKNENWTAKAGLSNKLPGPEGTWAAATRLT